MTGAVPRVTLLTDFGVADGYVAAMKGVIAARLPGVHLDDVAHDLPQGDVRAAMWALRRYAFLYPPGTVHLVVVDPGVGTERRALAVEVEGRFVVAPDNGIVSLLLDVAGGWEAAEVARVEAPSAEGSTTFHGRDVFAPAAAALAAGDSLGSLGPEVADPVVLEVPRPSRREGVARGEVVRVDRFGNLVTNLPGRWLEELPEVEVGRRRVRRAPSYGHVEEGGLLAVVNSDRLVEVAVRDGSAAERLDAGVGTPVRLRR